MMDNIRNSPTGHIVRQSWQSCCLLTLRSHVNICKHVPQVSRRTSFTLVALALIVARMYSWSITNCDDQEMLPNSFMGMHKKPAQRSWSMLVHSDVRSASPYNRIVLLRAVAGPPTVPAPPSVDNDMRVGRQNMWEECLIEYSSGQAAEVWVFRKVDRGEFDRLLHLRINRGYPPGGDVCENIPDFNAAGVFIQCRERSVDPTLVCADCIRVLTGGAYGNGGISVPAYPRKEHILDCLDLSRKVAIEQGTREDGSPIITKLTETAFCNSVNVRGFALS